MGSMLESELSNKDDRLKRDNSRLETLISCVVTQFISDEKWESRKRTVRQDKQYHEITERFKVMSWSMNVSYQAKDMRSGSIIDSANLSEKSQSEYLDGNNAPFLHQIEEQMLQGIIGKITKRLTPTVEQVEVLLAKDKLENASKRGQAGLWSQMLEMLETMPQLSNPQDDAYRIYNIGVAYEAMAYGSEDLVGTTQNLEKAAVHYKKAIEMRPEEKYFREPQSRIQTAIKQYKELESNPAVVSKEANKAQAEQVPSRSVLVTPSPSELRQDASPAPNKPLTNQDLIDLAKAGLDEEGLVTTIKEAPATQFDLSPQGLMHLLKNGVSNRVITQMRARQAPKKPIAPRSRKRP
jgi:hypothetical protein